MILYDFPLYSTTLYVEYIQSLLLAIDADQRARAQIGIGTISHLGLRRLLNAYIGRASQAQPGIEPQEISGQTIFRPFLGTSPSNLGKHHHLPQFYSPLTGFHSPQRFSSAQLYSGASCFESENLDDVAEANQNIHQHGMGRRGPNQYGVIEGRPIVAVPII